MIFITLRCYCNLMLLLIIYHLQISIAFRFSAPLYLGGHTGIQTRIKLQKIRIFETPSLMNQWALLAADFNCWRSVSSSHDPSYLCPFINKPGVPLTPLLTPLSKSFSTFPERDSF